MGHILKRSGAVAVIIPWRFRGFDYYKMIQELQPNLPKLKHVVIAGEEIPKGTISLKEIYGQPLETKYPSDYLRETRYSPSEATHIGVTTGTTGIPKLVLQGDAGIKSSAKDTVERTALTKDDVIACISPLSGGGTSVLAFYCAPLVAAKVVIAERFDAEESLRIIEKEKATILSGVPATLIRMLHHPELDRYNLTSLRVVFYYGAPLTYPTAKEIEKRFGCQILTRYGSLDIANISCTSIQDPPEVRLLTAGKPYSGCKIKLFDDAGREVMRGQEGEIWVSGVTTTCGFYEDAEATNRVWNCPGKEGWGATGDIGRFDQEGNLILVGRKKEIIIRGGQNIYPLEIENLLQTHPKVSSVAVIGMPDPVMGERVCACVVTKPGQQLLFGDMVSFLKEKGIASFKFPERLEVMDCFPLVGDHKIDKRQLERDMVQKLQREGKVI
jgi:non-ribosomal peptide synthetase component E (peptide arylation enzyme)